MEILQADGVTLKWITITCNNTIYISMMLQSMVDEMMRLKTGGSLLKPSQRPKEARPELKVLIYY